MKRTIAILAGIFLSLCAHAAEITDATAKQQAIRMEKLVARAKNGLNQLIESGERHRYRTVVRDSVQFALDAWPGSGNENRPLFPYFACRQAAVDLLQYGDAWVRNDRDKSWRDHAVKNFRADHKECQRAIAKPDMSLKEVR